MAKGDPTIEQTPKLIYWLWTIRTNHGIKESNDNVPMTKSSYKHPTNRIRRNRPMGMKQKTRTKNTEEEEEVLL